MTETASLLASGDAVRLGIDVAVAFIAFLAGRWSVRRRTAEPELETEVWGNTASTLSLRERREMALSSRRIEEAYGALPEIRISDVDALDRWAAGR